MNLISTEFLSQQRTPAGKKSLTEQSTAAPWGAAAKIPILLSGVVGCGCQSSDVYLQDIFPISSSEIAGLRDDQVRGFHSGQVPIQSSVGSALRSPAPSPWVTLVYPEKSVEIRENIVKYLRKIPSANR